MTRRSPVPCLLATLVVASLPGLARGQSLTALELKCMLYTAKAEAKFVQGKFKCVSKCWYEYWHSGSMASYADCLPPYGGATAFCINDTLFGLKGVENKFSASLTKACAVPLRTDCPECYSGGDCTAETTSHVALVESEIDSFVPGIVCERASAMPQEQWCQRGVMKIFAKFENAVQKCYSKCQSNAFKGLVSASACQPLPSDPATAACINKATTASEISINKICNDVAVPHSVPECDDASTYLDAAAWTNLFAVVTTGNVAGTFCGSPSGAFAD